MAVNVAALTGAIANMAAIETEFQANWDTLDHMRHPKRNTVVVFTNLAAAGTLKLFVRSTVLFTGAVPVWAESAAGSFTVPAKSTTDSSDWAQARFVLGSNDYSGFVVHASGACTVQLFLADT